MSTSESPPPAKRAAGAAAQLRDVKSIEEQAEQYRLGTVKFPLNALTTTWKLGSNRRINEKHVHALYEKFKDEGLQREVPINHLLVECGRDDFERMMDHLRVGGVSIPECPSFDEWMRVTGNQAEVMAGQHRMEALRLSPDGAPAAGNQAWWTCRVYDTDRLPHRLRMRLRENRQGSTLPDSHGQIWMELATAAKFDPSLFQGVDRPVKYEMLDMLGLSGTVKFPIRRLVTLWRNLSWQTIITSWCQTAIGRATFNLSLWDDMARFRMDDFWFDTFDSVLKVITKLGKGALESMSLSDWNCLVRLKAARSDTALQSLFYPGASPDVLANLETKGCSCRHKEFLVACTDTTYYEIYTKIQQNSNIRFLDIQAFLYSSRAHGKVLSQVLTHVGQWLSTRMAPVGAQDTKKAQLWEHFLPAFRRRDGDETEAEERARTLQRQILASSRDRVSELTRESARSYLSKLPDAQGEAYLERFSHAIWRDILLVVRDAAGGQFQGPLAKFNRQDPNDLPQRRQSMLMQNVRESVSRIPEISSNPALRNSAALDELMVAVKAWAVEKNEKALQAQRLNQMPPWPSHAREVVMSQQRELSSSVPGGEVDDASLPSGTQPRAGADVVSYSPPSTPPNGNSAVKHVGNGYRAGGVRQSSLDEEGRATQQGAERVASKNHTRTIKIPPLPECLRRQYEADSAWGQSSLDEESGPTQQGAEWVAIDENLTIKIPAPPVLRRLHHETGSAWNTVNKVLDADLGNHSSAPVKIGLPVNPRMDAKRRPEPAWRRSPAAKAMARRA
ncbi:hypothetical protein V498_05204 [Pseudogymnoascus sp. VKM F-4517 (FW-2822)]|nr:hypothetical protein V498_05204 [Pseudogymnoascus sp. VKM F-4517 (FW-2822)]